jgi:hypothetical protein
MCQGTIMASRQWRDRLTYLAMSAFVAFHTVVIVIVPNASATGASLRALVQPYLSLFALEATWTFFAPSVGKDSEFRYVIEDATGHEHTFIPLKQFKWFLPSYYFVRSLYYAVMDDTENFAGYFAAQACRDHAALRPVAVTMIELKEQDFRLEDYRRGKRPTDPEFVIENPLKTVECQN